MPNGSVTVVQESRGNNATAVSSQTFNLASDLNNALAQTTPGTALVVYVSCVTKTRSITSISDSAGNTGWQVIGGTGSSGNLYMAVLPAANHVSAITSFTVNASGTSKFQVVFREVKGISGVINNGGTAFAFDNHGTAATTQASATTTLAAGGKPKWVIAAATAVTIPTSVASPFTTDTTINGGGQGIQIFSGDSTQLGAGSITATFTQTSEVGTSGIVAFDILQGSEVPLDGDFPLDGRTGADGPWTGPLRMFIEARSYDIGQGPTGTETDDADTAALSLTAGNLQNAGLSNPFQALIDAQFIAGANTTPVVLTVPTGMVIPVGDEIVVFASSSTQYFTIADSHSHSWTTDGNVGSAGGAGATATRGFRTTVATQFVAGDTITVTPTTTVAGKIAAAVWMKDIQSLDTGADVLASDNTTTATGFTDTSPSALAEPHAVVLNAYALANDRTASATPDTGWTRLVTLAHASGTIITLAIDLKEFLSGGTPTEAVSWAGASSYSTLFFPYALPIPVYGEAAQFIDAGTGTLSLVASGAEVVPYADADTGALSLVASAADTAQFVDADTAALSNVASATEAPVYAESTTCALSLVASAVEAAQFVDAATAALALVASTYVEYLYPADDIPHHGRYPRHNMYGPWRGPVGAFYENHDAPPLPTVQYTDADTAYIRFVASDATAQHYLGTSITAAQTTVTAYHTNVESNFQAVTPEYEMNWAQVEPTQNTFTFTNMDTIVAYAKAHGLEVFGHPLVWHANGDTGLIPTWLTGGSWTVATLKAALSNHITTVINRYKDYVHDWVVVNEALDSGGSHISWILQTVLGDQWIELAFQYAHAADPTAKLWYNDYSIDWGFFGGNTKYDAALALFTDFKARGVPLHGIGVQGHYDLQFTDYPDVSDLTGVFGSYQALGLDVRVSELDVRIDNVGDPLPTKLTNQAANYQRAVDAINAAGATHITVWGVSDATNWLGTTAAAAPFDTSYAPKPAWETIRTFPSTLDIAAFTDAATCALSLVASAADTVQDVDAVTCTLSLVASATETAQFVDSDTCALSLVTSGTEFPVQGDTATCALTLVASDVQEFDGVDASTASLTLVAGGVELIPSAYDIPYGGVFPKTTMPGPFRGPVGYFHEERPTLPIDYVEAPVLETCTLTLVASGVEAYGYTDADTGALLLVASASESYGRIDADTGALSLVCSGADTAQYTEASIVPFTLDCSGSTEAQQGATTDAATATLTIVGTASELHISTVVFVDDEFNRTVSGGLGTASPIGGAYTLTVSASKYSVNGTRARIISDATTERAAIQAVGQADTDSNIIAAYDAVPVSHQFKFGMYARRTGTTSVNEYAARVQLDSSGNVKLRIDKMIAGTIFNLVPEATILTGYTATDDLKLRFLVSGNTLSAKLWDASVGEPGSWTQQATDNDLTTGDNGFYGASNSTLEGTTISFESYTVVGPGVADEVTYFDGDTASLSFVASAVETERSVEAATVPLSLVASGTEAIGDFGTALLHLDASLSLEDYYVDTFLVTFLLEASAIEGFSYRDTATANLLNTASATFVNLYNDNVTCFLTTFSFDLLPHAQFVDGSIAVLLLVAVDFTETQPVYDYYLATTLSVRYTTIAVGFRWGTVASGRFSTDAQDRFDTNGVGFDPRG